MWKMRIPALALLLVILALPVLAAGVPVVIDARTEAEWKAGHLEGAVLLPHDRIAEGIGKAAPYKKERIYLYCRSGHRSGIALETLKKLGYEDLVNLGSVEEASRKLKRPIVR